MEIPKIFTKEELIYLSDTGRDCEVCGFHMHEHDWAALDVNGFVVFCSRLKYVDADYPEIVLVEYYSDDELPEINSLGSATPRNIERMLPGIKDRAQADINDEDGPYKIEIRIQKNVNFTAFDHKKSIKIGNWHSNEQ